MSLEVLSRRSTDAMSNRQIVWIESGYYDKNYFANLHTKVLPKSLFGTIRTKQKYSFPFSNTSQSKKINPPKTTATEPTTPTDLNDAPEA
jgi:hypothetical protein